jgi:hypothetical protein
VVNRSNLETKRAGWTGQSLGEAMDVTVLSNYYGELNGKTYNVTEAYVNTSNAFLTADETAQVFWRVLSDGDDGYDSSTTCFNFVYRANSLVTTNDEEETSCTRNSIPDGTLDFTPFAG